MTNTVIVYRDQWGRLDARELTDTEEKVLDWAFDWFYNGAEANKFDDPTKRIEQWRIDNFLAMARALDYNV